MTTVQGRSLWADARGRLVRNRAALASIVLLSLIALACLIGPLFTGHDYDQVYQDYVRVARQHLQLSQPEQIRRRVDRIASRMRAKVERADGRARQHTCHAGHAARAGRTACLSISTAQTCS